MVYDLLQTYMTKPCFFIQYDNLWSFIGLFRSFIFKIIVNTVEFKSDFLLFLSCFPHPRFDFFQATFKLMFFLVISFYLLYYIID